MLLSALIFLPLLYILVVLALPTRFTRVTSVALSLFHFVLSLGLLFRFDPASSALQLVEKTSWIPSLGINYFVGIDGISLWLVILTTLLTPITILASWRAVERQVKGFHACMFLLMTFMIGTFLAMDIILFYVFFEASLIPMYFMIGIWGGQRKIYATVKFFIYTMFGSLFMLLAIIGLMVLGQEQFGQITASIPELYKLNIPFVAGDFLNTQTLMFFAFALAFAIKVPMFPVHTWLPDAHVEAPTPGSVILAAIMLKMGTYGFMRFALPLFPQAVDYWTWLFMIISAFGIIYGALVAMVQPDFKKLVAYSSVSHMGYVMLGLFAFNIYGMTGGLFQMLNHGISTGALFLLIGMIYERTHTRQISEYGGLASVAPILAIMFVVVTMSSIGVPLTNGFVGEFLVLMGTYLAGPRYAYVAVIGVILGAVYMLWMVKRIFFGAESELVKKYSSKLEMNFREMVVMAPLIVLIFWMGIKPDNFLDWSRASLEHLVDSKGSYSLAIYGEQNKSENAKQEAQKVLDQIEGEQDAD